VNDIILVDTKDAILVLDKKYAQDVKKIYERLEKEDPNLLA
jgi:mannose-1-phosphate guanylyltransferase